MSYNTNNIDKVLGQRVDSPSTYTPEILVREERQRNRTHLDLKNGNLPFVGYDIWNGYECSALTNNGLPVTCVAKVVYSSENDFIVESKSMKLYWNSFNMQKMGKNTKEVLKNIKETASKDLSLLLETDVKVELFSQIQDAKTEENRLIWFSDHNPLTWLPLEQIKSAEKIKFTVFNENADLLVANDSETNKQHFYMSTLLRSNCKITKQPDSGDIFIYYKGDKEVTEQSLLEWIVSLRN